MPTRFYVRDETGAVTPSSWNSGWNKTSGSFTQKRMLTTPAIAGTDALNANMDNAGSGTSGQFVAIIRYESDALDAQTISGTIKGATLCLETNSTDDYTLAIAAKVITSAGADRGVLLQPTASTSVDEFPFPTGTSYRPRTFRDASDNEDITLSSVVCSATDRLVVEVGYRTGSTSVANGGVWGIQPTTGWPTAPMGYANTDATITDAWPGSTWFQFSDDIAPFSTTGVSEILYIGSAATPADSSSATNTADPTAVTPPGDLESGDLVLMIGQQRATGATLAVSEASGQSWTTANAIGATNQTSRLFWCIFNGTWGSNPSVDFSATTCNSVQMHAFRPPSGSNFVINQALVELDTAGSPATVTGQTTTGTNPTLTVAGWFTADDNTWGAISGTGWTQLGFAQYRNTSGSDQSSSYAWFSSPTSGATGNVAQTQLANGPDAGTTFIISWAAEEAIALHGQAIF